MMVNSSSRIMAKTFNRRLAYPISKLDVLSVGNLNLDTLIEVVVDDYGNNSYANKQTSIRTIGDYLVSAHPIFNKIDDVYNDKTITMYDLNLDEEIYRYNSHIYFSGQTYFEINPYSKDETKFENLILNQTVQKKQLERFVHDVAFEVDAIQNDYRCIQYKKPFGWWSNSSTDESPTFNERTIVQFDEPAAECTFDRSHLYAGHLYRTGEITFYRNTFATIIGKVRVPNFKVTKPYVYYTPEKNLWAAVLCGANIIAITELHNFNNDGIAYFSMQLPVSFGQKIRVVVPFQPGEYIAGSETETLFSNIKTNSVCVFYYAPNQTE